MAAAPDQMDSVAWRNGGEGHDRQGYIGYIVEEGAYVDIFDLPADQCQGQETDQRDHAGHDENIQIDIMIHGLIPPL